MKINGLGYKSSYGTRKIENTSNSKECVNNVFDNYDAFGAPVPSFTIKGRTHQGTSIGLIATVVMTCVIGAFSTNKFIHLVKRVNPSISTAKF